MPRAGRLRHVPGRDPGCGPLLSCPQISAEIQNQPCCYTHGLMNGHGCSSCVKQCERFLNFIHFPITSGNDRLNRLNRYHRLGVSGGEGVHVGEDEVAGAIVAEGGFVFTVDYGESVQHVLRVFLGQAVEVEVERVEAGA